MCREHDISNPTRCQCKSKYGGSEASDLKRMKELESDNSKLKLMYSGLAPSKQAVKDLLGWLSGRRSGVGRPDV